MDRLNPSTPYKSNYNHPRLPESQASSTLQQSSSGERISTTNISERLVHKITDTQNQTTEFSARVLEDLISNNFFKESSNINFIQFKNQDSGMVITVNRASRHSFDAQVEDQLSSITGHEYSVNQPQPNQYSSPIVGAYSTRMSPPQRTSKDIPNDLLTLARNGGYNLEKTEQSHHGETWYRFKSHVGNHTFSINTGSRTPLASQLHSELNRINELESRTRQAMSIAGRGQNMSNASQQDWISKVEKTVKDLQHNSQLLDCVNSVVERGFYLEKTDSHRNENYYYFKSRDGQQTFSITTDSFSSLRNQLQNELNRQLQNELNRFNHTETTTQARPISDRAKPETLPEGRISSYAYKVIVVGTAMSKIDDSRRRDLIQSMENPQVKSVTTFKSCMREGISKYTSEQDKASHNKLINETNWTPPEINTIIRKGILMLDN